MSKIDSGGSKPEKTSLNLHYDKDGSQKIDTPQEWAAIKKDLKIEFGKIYGEDSEKYKNLCARMDNTIFSQASLGHKDAKGSYEIATIEKNTLQHSIKLAPDKLDISSNSPEELKANILNFGKSIIHEEEHAQQIEFLYKNFKEQAKNEHGESFDEAEFNHMFKKVINDYTFVKDKDAPQTISKTSIPKEKQKVYVDLLQTWDRTHVGAEVSATIESVEYIKKLHDAYPNNPKEKKEVADYNAKNFQETYEMFKDIKDFDVQNPNSSEKINGRNKTYREILADGAANVYGLEIKNKPKHQAGIDFYKALESE